MNIDFHKAQESKVEVDVHHIQEDDEFACLVIDQKGDTLRLYFNKAVTILNFMEKINDAYIKGIDEALEEKQKKTQVQP